MTAKLLSARWWVTLLLVGTACAMLLWAMECPEWFTMLVGIVVRDYFGRDDRGAK
jgi:hypothetical protein